MILLDHGLYKQLDDDFRLDYCRLWKVGARTRALGLNPVLHTCERQLSELCRLADSGSGC